MRKPSENNSKCHVFEKNWAIIFLLVIEYIPDSNFEGEKGNKDEGGGDEDDEQDLLNAVSAVAGSLVRFEAILATLGGFLSDVSEARIIIGSHLHHL